MNAAPREDASELRTGKSASRLAVVCGAFVVVAFVFAAGIMAFAPNAVWSLVGIPLALIIVVAGIVAGRTAAPSVLGIPRLGFRIAAIVALPLAALWIGYMFAGPGYYAEFNRLKAGIAAIPGIELVEIGGNRDLTYEDIWARVRVNGKGDIVLIALTPAALSSTANLHVSHIGPFSVRKERWGYGAVIDREGKQVWHQSIGFTLDVGADGDFGHAGKLAGRLQPPIANVRELIQRYDEVCAVLESLRQETWFFRNDDGSTLEYFIRHRP